MNKLHTETWTDYGCFFGGIKLIYREMVAEYKIRLLRTDKNNVIINSTAVRRALGCEEKHVLSYALNELEQLGSLTRVCEDVYEHVLQTRFGMKHVTDESIIKLMTSNQHGTAYGYLLFNRLGLTTQIGKKQEVLTCYIDNEHQRVHGVDAMRVCPKDGMDWLLIEVMEVLASWTSIEDVRHTAVREYLTDARARISNDGLNRMNELNRYDIRVLSMANDLARYGAESIFTRP